jgi:hypothetical protein
LQSLSRILSNNTFLDQSTQSLLPRCEIYAVKPSLFLLKIQQNCYIVYINVVICFSGAKREKISVYERTRFATGMGCFGILILTSIAVFMFILDIPDYINIFKRKFPFSKIIAFFLCLCIKEETKQINL